MKTSRLEAFSDGVIAVIITIMVLELKVPRTPDVAALEAVVPSLLVYGLSFAVIAIMWVNHHSMLERARRAEPALLWANNNLLFWMSLTPFSTAYLGQHCYEKLAVGLYGAVMVCSCSAFLVLQITLARQQADDPEHQLLFRRLNHKALASIGAYAASVGLAFWSVYASFAIFVIIPLLYFWPEQKGATGEKAG